MSIDYAGTIPTPSGPVEVLLTIHGGGEMELRARDESRRWLPPATLVAQPAAEVADECTDCKRPIVMHYAVWSGSRSNFMAPACDSVTGDAEREHVITIVRGDVDCPKCLRAMGSGCSCGSPDTYSLNAAEAVVHRADGPCYIADAHPAPTVANPQPAPRESATVVDRYAWMSDGSVDDGPAPRCEAHDKALCRTCTIANAADLDAHIASKLRNWGYRPERGI